MSVITFPGASIPAALAGHPTQTRPQALPEVRRRPTHVAAAPRRRAVTRTWRGRRHCEIVRHRDLRARAFNGGSMVVANRQVELHALQSQLLQSQSTTPSRWDRIPISPPPVSWRPRPVPCTWSTRLGDASPVTSLDEPLRLPKFLGYAPATSRTIREHALFADSHAHPGPAPPARRRASGPRRLVMLGPPGLSVRRLGCDSSSSSRRSRALRQLSVARSR